MRNFRYVFATVLGFLSISLACNALLPGSDTSPRIAYSQFIRGEGVYIHTVKADGQSDVRLTGEDCLALWPTWSTDGSLIVYNCYDPDQEKVTLWVMKRDGSEERLVTEVPDLFTYSWSPDNKHLVYHALEPKGDKTDIYVMDITNAEITNLTEDSPAWDAFPNWSPDGSRIAFSADRTEGGGNFLDDVWTMKPDGSDLVNLTNNNSQIWEDYYPVWSPDGKTIAFFRNGPPSNTDVEGGPEGLWVMEANGRFQKLVTALEAADATNPAVWSPDGQYLAYTFGPEGGEGVWVVPSAGGEPVNVGSMAGKKNYISWSPDSKTLIFTNDNDAEDTLLIYTALPDGSDTHPLLSEGRYGYGDWMP